MIKEQQAREAAKVVLLRWDDHYRPQSHSEGAEHKAATWITQELARRDWQDEPSGEGWYWCEELDADAPPQKIDRNGDGKFRRWTVAGWLDLNGRVCKIMERPA